MLSQIVFAAALAAAAPQHLDETSVRAAENGWSEAFFTGDTAYLDALLAPGYVSVNPAGKARERAEIIAAATTFAAQHQGQHAKPMPDTSTIQLIGSTALVRHHLEHETSIDLFSFEGGRWRAVYSQHTTIAPTT